MSTGEFGPCATCHTAGAAHGPYTLWHKVPLCPACLETARRAEAEAAHPPDPVTTAAVAAELGNGQTDHLEALINWPLFWARDRTAPEWAIEPIIPRGKSIAVFAQGGLGKSELLLAVTAAAATGRRILNQPAGTPLRTLYIDLEQTEDDLYDRLDELGYGPSDDLGPLIYYMLPDLPPLDTPDGGDEIMRLATQHNAGLVIIDTTARVLQGPENDADTIRALYRHTGRPLKAAGHTVVRIDHAGKDLEKGMRGTSAKTDDVDVVWRLTQRDNGTRLTATKRRSSWVPEQVDLVRLQDPLRYELALETWPEGTTEVAFLLDALEVDPNASRRVAGQALREAGEKARNNVIGAAQKWRRQSGTTPGTTIAEPHPGPPRGPKGETHAT